MTNLNGIIENILQQVTVIQDYKYESAEITYKLVHHIDEKNNFKRYEVQAWAGGELQRQVERNLLSTAQENFNRAINQKIASF